MINNNSYAPFSAGKRQPKSQSLSQATGRITQNYKLDWMQSVDEDEFNADGKEDAILRSRRHTINGEILKQLRLRTGAENMLEALRDTKDKRRQKVLEMELSFVNSNLQLLKEALAEINCPVLSDGLLKKLPVVPLALKQSTEIDVKVTFMDFILEHYSEDAKNYSKAIEFFHQLRKESLEVKPDMEGIKCLTDYYNQLYYIEHRFFPNSRCMGVYFQWYDAISGFPTSETSVPLEKGAVLYNLGALWSQIGAKQNREEKSGCEEAASAFAKASGFFSHLRNNFTQSPSRDMSTDTLDLLSSLMLAQSQECLYEVVTFCNKDDLQSLIRTATEAAEVADAYDVTCLCLKNDDLQSYIPQAWRSLISVKALYYKATAHRLVAECLIQHGGNKHLKDRLSKVMIFEPSSVTQNELNTLSGSGHGRKRLARANLRSALRHLEDSLRKHRSCKMLRKIDIIQKILHSEHESTLRLLNTCEDENDFTEVVAPGIRGNAAKRAFPIEPDFSIAKTVDFFRELGPLTVFSANSQWSAPRKIHLVRSANGYGCTLSGSCPVSVQIVDEDGIAKKQGLKSGDYIVKLYGNNVKWSRHQDVVDAILKGHGKIDMDVVTPQNVTRVPSSHMHAPISSGQMSNARMKGLLSSPNSSIKSAIQRTSGKKDKESERRSLPSWE